MADSLPSPSLAARDGVRIEPLRRSPVARALSWLVTRLGARRAPALVIAFALLLSLPMLWVRIDSDDYFQIAALSGHSQVDGVARAPWDLYSYAKDAAHNTALRESGVWPWWANVDVVLAFFRPLSSLSRWLDQTLWPGNYPLMQLHSMAWFAALLVVLARLYRRLIPAPWVASVALFAFGCDEARAGTIAWLCNRHALVSLVFAFAALLAHHRARSEGSRSAAWLAPLWLALGLLGGESALQGVGYLLAYALFLDRGGWAARARSLAPYALVCVLWLIGYKLLGYGAHGTSAYVDPVRNPLSFARLLPERLLVYQLSLFGGVATDWIDVLSLMKLEPMLFLLPLGLICITLLTLALRPLFKHDPLVRFWTVGALLSALPACSVRPSDRLMTGAAVGGMALLASLLGSVVEGRYPVPTRGCWLKVTAGGLAFINLVAAPIIHPYLICLQDDFDGLMARADATFPADDAMRAQTVVLLNPPWDTFAIFLRLRREVEGEPQPRRLRWLATGATDLRVERVDARSLKIAPVGGFLNTPSQQVMRNLDQPFHVGERVALQEVTFEVLSLTSDARPQEVLVRFAEPLESASLRLLQWGRSGYVPFVPPAIGQTVTVAAADLNGMLAEK